MLYFHKKRVGRPQLSYSISFYIHIKIYLQANIVREVQTFFSRTSKHFNIMYTLLTKAYVLDRNENYEKRFAKFDLQCA